MTEIELVRELYAALGRRDTAGLFELIDGECVVTQDPALPWGGRHVGHDSVAEPAIALTTSIDSAVTIEAVFSADGDVFQYGRTRARCAPTAWRSTFPRCTGGRSETERRWRRISPSTRRRCCRR